MTMPREVQGAVKELDAVHDQRFAPWRSQWQAIRAHLMSQDADIARLTSRCESAERDCREYRQIQIEDSARAELAESRLAAANALLREIRDSTFRSALTLRGMADRYLQGAGDEA